MRISIMVFAMALLASFGKAAFAHHSFAAFDMKKEMWIDGTVSEVQYKNPHAWLFVDVVTAKGDTETWALETGGPNLLIRAGWKKNTVKVGDKVKVLIHPMRDASKKAGSVQRVVLPDGRTLTGF